MIMPNTGLEGPYHLSLERIDEVVTETSPGVYVLEREKDPNSFIMNYVGRSDDDVNDRLKDWVDESGYKRFKFAYFGSPKAAFEKECKIYHDFSGPNGKLDNEKHPQRPEGTNWQCPRCDKFKNIW